MYLLLLQPLGIFRRLTDPLRLPPGPQDLRLALILLGLQALGLLLRFRFLLRAHFSGAGINGKHEAFIVLTQQVSLPWSAKRGNRGHHAAERIAANPKRIISRVLTVTYTCTEHTRMTHVLGTQMQVLTRTVMITKVLLH